MSVTPSVYPIVPTIKKKSMLTLLEKGHRRDGRRLDEYRSISIETNYVEKAEGSALVKIGDTMVLAGVKTGVGTPFPDTPNSGVLQVNAEFVPLASPSFEPGPPDENALELARVVDRSLREIKAVDLEKLAIIPGKKVWLVWIDIYVLDHNGNLLDASMLAAMAALLTAKMPEAKIEGEDVVLDRSKYVNPIPVNHRIVTVTVGKVNNYLLVDPDLEEESILDGRIAFAVSGDGRIAGIQKMGMGPFSMEEIVAARDIALKKAEELHGILVKAVPEEKTGRRTKPKNTSR